MGANYEKVASLKVKNGTYTDKDGNEKNRYTEVGVLLSTPHGSQLLIKLHATVVSDPKLVSVFIDDGVKFSMEHEEEVPTDIPDGPVNMEEIPF